MDKRHSHLKITLKKTLKKYIALLSDRGKVVNTKSSNKKKLFSSTYYLISITYICNYCKPYECRVPIVCCKI